ncbi:MAG: fibronectin type III domain-containing protein, partial [Verrucomicrobiota bacterium]
ADDGGSSRHRGMIDEVRVMDTGVSAAWVAAAYSNMAPGSTFVCLNQVDDMSAPLIENMAGADGLLPNGATLNGELLSEGIGPATVRVYYGLTDGGADTSAWANVVGIGMPGAGPVSANVTGLSIGSNYFYRFYAFNGAGDSWACTSVSFVTVSGPPMVDNDGGVTNLGLGAATLRGRLTAGGSAEVSLFWGTSDGGTDIGSWDQSVDFGPSGEGTVSASLSGLLYGIPYVYRTYASNVFGSAWAPGSVTFKTPAPGYVVPRGLNVSAIYGLPRDNAEFNLPSLLDPMPRNYTGGLLFDEFFDYDNDVDFRDEYDPAQPNDDYLYLFEGFIFLEAGEG